MSKTRTLAKKSMRALEYREKYDWKAETQVGAANPKTIHHIERFGPKAVREAILGLKPVPEGQSVVEKMPMRTVLVEATDTATTDVTPTLIPTRSKCPDCDTSQKVTKAGVMGKHNAKYSDGERVCQGVGVQWDKFSA